MNAAEMTDTEFDEWMVKQDRGFDAAMSDYPDTDYRLTDEFDEESEAFQVGYQQAWTYQVKQDVQSRYPGYDNPHSTPPAWFDPADAGEVW